MTTIVAVENSDHVIIASDSQVTSGMQKASLSAGKIFTNGEYTMGVAGYFRLLQALEFMDLPVAPETSGSLYSFVVRTLVPHIIKETADLPTGHEGQTQFNHSSILIAIRGEVFSTGGDGSVVHSRPGIHSIGSGSHYALGSLAHIDGEPTQADVIRALKAAARHDIGTGGPFWLRTL